MNHDPKGWKRFAELDRLLELAKTLPYNDWSPFDKFWLKQLLELDFKCKEQVRNGDDNGFAQLMQICQNAVDTFLGGRSVEELTGREIDDYNDLNALLRQALKHEREKAQGELEEAKANYTANLPGTIH